MEYLAAGNQVKSADANKDWPGIFEYFHFGIFTGLSKAVIFWMKLPYDTGWLAIGPKPMQHKGRWRHYAHDEANPVQIVDPVIFSRAGD